MNQAEELKTMMRERHVIKPSLARVITVTSGKGGVGKSSISVNLALEFAKLGKKVIILDADFGLANIEVMLGIRPKSTLADVIFEGKKITEVITQGPEGIGFISGGSGIHELNKLNLTQIDNLVQQLYELDEYADIIIVDTGAGISDIIFQFVAASSEVLVVATPEPTSLTDAYAMLKSLDREKDNMNDISIKLVSNRVANSTEGVELYNRMNSVVNKFLKIKLDYLGAVIQDSNQNKALMKQKPITLLFPSSPASKSISSLTAKLCEQNAEISQRQRGLSRLFSKIMRSGMIKKGEIRNGA